MPGLDPRYDAVVAKAIREDRDIRYQSAAELRADLDSILTQPVVKVDPAATHAPAALPTVARPQRPQGYVQRPVQPVPKKSSSTGILLVAVLVLAAGGFFVFKDKLLPAPAPTQPVTAETSKTDPATPAPSAEETVKKDTASITPSATTSQTTSMPVAVPKTEPVTSKPVAPQTELEKRIAVLEVGFQNAAKAEPEQVFQQSMAALNKSYLAALDRSLATATQKGELDDAVALREEKQRMEKGSAVPSLLEESTLVTPVRETVKKLRDTYRATQLQHATTKAKAIAALYDKYDQALVAIQTDLTKAKKLDEALDLKPVREQISQRKAAVLAMKPSPVAIVPTSAAAVPTSGLTNSLGMKFVPIPNTNILMCIHETRRQDYAAYAGEVNGVNEAWKNQSHKGVEVGHENTHPVVAVSWDDANSFCRWLGKKEGRVYRLPSDQEWSVALGIAEQENFANGVLPEKRSGLLPAHFPWKGAFPPKSTEKAGNYGDIAFYKAFSQDPHFEDYLDGYSTTAPVMSYEPNKLGIYDLGGNVWEWVQDKWNGKIEDQVSRGGSWFSCGNDMRSTARDHRPPGHRYMSRGFRCVLEIAGTQLAASTPTKPKVIPTPSTASIAASTPNVVASASNPITNTLGMKFVPVPGTQILLCAHETRRADYAAYAAETPAVDASWKDQKEQGNPVSLEDACPVVAVNWNDAQAFCEWLSKKEGRTYRLPTELEWSHAAGIGPDEERIGPARTGGMNVPNTYPWGNSWPPPAGAGNYADEKVGQGLPGTAIISGYADGYLTTAPVMQFKPNALGIYDLGGNVKEWCADRWSDANTDRIVREGDWAESRREYLLSSARTPAKITTRSSRLGFRVAMEVKDALPGALTSEPASKPSSSSPAVSVPVVAKSPTSDPIVSQAVFFATTGQVSVTGKDGSANDAGRAEPPPQGAAVVTSVSAGGMVKTGPKSSAALALVGGGSVQLDADSEMIFSAVNEGRPAVESLELRKGRLFIHVEAADLARMGRASLLIKTPVGTVAVQGGKCYVEIGASYETIGVFKGLVEVMETQSGSKAVVKDEMTLAAKAGRLSPPQRLAMAQTALRKVCDQIELVRTELSLMPLDDVLEKTLEDVYFYLGNNQRITLEGSVSAAPVISSTKASGTLLMIKPNQPPKLRSRTIGYSPKIDLTRFKPEILAVEFGCRSDGVEQLEPDLQGHDPDSGLFDIIPFGANYIYYVGRRVHMQPGTGKLGEWTNRIYPMFPPTSGPKLKFIRAEYRVCVKEDESYLVPGRQEYRLEISPLVVITRKQQP